MSDFTGGAIATTIEEIIGSNSVTFADPALRNAVKSALAALSDDLDDGAYDPTDTALEAYEVLDAQWTLQETEEDEEDEEEDEDEDEDFEDEDEDEEDEDA